MRNIAVDLPVWNNFVHDDFVHDHVLVDFERVAEHVLTDRGGLNFPEGHLGVLQVVLVVPHLADGQGVPGVLIHKLGAGHTWLEVVGPHPHNLVQGRYVH